MKSPCTLVVPHPRDVWTVKGPGNIQLTSAAAVRPPRICATKSKAPRAHGRAPIRHIPNVTAGLNSPPEIRKKTHALTASEKPNDNAMYCSCCGLLPVCATVIPDDDGMLLATCVPPSAKYRKSTVPTYSPTAATKWLRTTSGMRWANGMRLTCSSTSSRRSGSAAFVNGSGMAAPLMGAC